MARKEKRHDDHYHEPHIRESRVGTFTAAATAHHMGVQEFASHVLANKGEFSSKMEKKAQFAKNASKFNNGHPG